MLFTWAAEERYTGSSFLSLIHEREGDRAYLSSHFGNTTIGLNLFSMAEKGLGQRMLCCAMRQLNQWAKLGHYVSNL